MAENRAPELEPKESALGETPKTDAEALIDKSAAAVAAATGGWQMHTDAPIQKEWSTDTGNALKWLIWRDQ